MLNEYVQSYQKRHQSFINWGLSGVFIANFKHIKQVSAVTFCIYFYLWTTICLLRATESFYKLWAGIRYYLVKWYAVSRVS